MFELDHVNRSHSWPLPHRSIAVTIPWPVLQGLNGFRLSEGPPLLKGLVSLVA
jgi:hypothetical protein